MEMKNVFKNFKFGPCGDRVKISHLGIATKNTNGEMVSYDKEKDAIVNVDLLNFEGKELVWLMPSAVKDIKVGDAILHNQKIMFVTSTKGDISAIDVAAGEKKIIMPTKSMFGFDFITKVVSMIDFSMSNADENNPFGNLLPLMLFNSDKNEENDGIDFSSIMMM